MIIIRGSTPYPRSALLSRIIVIRICLFFMILFINPLLPAITLSLLSPEILVENRVIAQ